MAPKRKIKKSFIDYGCGFPVRLVNVPLVFVRGAWTPDIDYNKLHTNILRAMARKPVPLNGNEIKFIRHYFELTLKEFGENFGVSHVAVMKWEKAGEESPSYSVSQDRDLRMFIMARLETDGDSLLEVIKSLHSAKGMLARKRQKKAKPYTLKRDLSPKASQSMPTWT